jgi:hypothetical protein
MKEFEELNMREYCMYALGASHAKDFEEYKKQFKETFLSQPDRLNPEDDEIKQEKNNEEI